jgi:hypothetical protein
LLNNLPEPDKKSAFRGVSCYTYLPEKQK